MAGDPGATKLLVSVRNAAEARAALAGGADLVDVKEPSRGPLGAADPAVIASVVAEVAGRVPTSAALGELQNADPGRVRSAVGVDYAKFGLAGCGSAGSWPDRLRAALDLLPKPTVPVAVVYADWAVAGAPEPWEVLERASSVGCGVLLIDTFDKRGGSLRRHLLPARLARLVSAARAAKLLCVVAGGLGLEDIEAILPLEPDYIGVRGAVCRGGRAGTLDPRKVRRLADRLQRRLPC